MSHLCIQCEGPFEAKRPDARFCGATCRKRHSRGGGVGKPVVADAQVEEKKPISKKLESRLEKARGVLAEAENKEIIKKKPALDSRNSLEEFFPGNLDPEAQTIDW